MYSFYLVPGTVLSILHMLTHPVSSTIIPSHYYFQHFTNQKAEAHRNKMTCHRWHSYIIMELEFKLTLTLWLEFKIRVVSMALCVTIKFEINSEGNTEPLKKFKQKKKFKNHIYVLENFLRQKCWGWLRQKQDTIRAVIKEVLAPVQTRNKGLREGRRPTTNVPWQ